MVAQDNRFLATSTGRLIAVHRNTLASTGVAAVIGSMALFGFSDHDAALVGLEPEGPQARPTIEVVGLSDGRAMALGNAAEVAGDPQRLGAFATVAAESQPGGPPPPGGYAGEADGRRRVARLRRAGRFAGYIGAARGRPSPRTRDR